MPDLTAYQQLVVSISDMKITARPRCALVTHSLGSCLGLAAYDPDTGLCGMIHCLLPDSTADARKAQKNPYTFVNSGVSKMLRTMIAKGANKKNIILKAAGCARMLNVQNQFDTGKRNYDALRKLLAKNNVKLHAEDVGGTIPRTMHMFADSGVVEISSLRKRWEL